MDENLKKEIVELFKSEGLDVAEEVAVVAVKVAIKAIKVALPKAAPAAVIFVNPILDLLEPKVLAMLDKIDGQDDAGR